MNNALHPVVWHEHIEHVIAKTTNYISKFQSHVVTTVHSWGGKYLSISAGMNQRSQRQ